MGCGAGKVQPTNTAPQKESGTAETRGSGTPAQEEQKRLSDDANDNTARKDSAKAPAAEPDAGAAPPAVETQASASADPSGAADANAAPPAPASAEPVVSQPQGAPDKSAEKPPDADAPEPEPAPEQDLSYEALTPQEMSKISTWVGEWLDAEQMWMPLPDLWGTTNPAYQQRIQKDAERRARDRQKQSELKENAEASVASTPTLTGTAVNSSTLSTAVPQTPVTPAPDLQRPLSPSQNDGDPSPNVSRIGGFGGATASSQNAQPSSSFAAQQPDASGAGN